MAQQLTVPRSEGELRQLQDQMYSISKEKIKNNSRPAFKDLIEIIKCDEVIISAIHRMKSNRGSKTPGVNGRTIDNILQMGYSEVIKMIVHKLDTYKAGKIRRVYIPKPGKTEKRPLGIPNIEDRIIQECIRMVIEPILEAQFFEHNYGFRPMRSSAHALERASHIAKWVNIHWVIEGDISKFFDNVNHRKLLNILWSMGIRDRRLLMIIKEMLKAGIINETEVNEKGTPQGSILSPLLANAYLSKFDEFVTKFYEKKEMKTLKSLRHRFDALKRKGFKQVFLVRYADDWIVFTNSKANAEKMKFRIQKFLKECLNLELSMEKTKITNIKKQPIKFLGFEIKCWRGKGKSGYVTRSKPDINRIKPKVRQILNEIREINAFPTEDEKLIQLHNINSMIRGLIEYYKYATRVNIVFNKFSKMIGWSAYKSLKKWGKAEWVRACDSSNLQIVHSEYTEKLAAIRVRGEKIAITSINMVRWTKIAQKNQDETPYSKEGRFKYLTRMNRRPLKERAMELNIPIDPIIMLSSINGAPKDKFNNFEYYMNRPYAYNRDKGKCRICGIYPSRQNIKIHHITKKLSINEVNKVKNLMTVCKYCYNKIHSQKEINCDSEINKKILKYREMMS
ncbi:group II intron reverse transcriptase/maturase [Clostridium sp. P21]|uniref:Group II intron reverse transcriptase/maturase n=1 Tax=Clostridium muellerianum TaxID=2716538 RepID=A0A7Y0HRG3_9CLOT|nr:group II intron reverse transcriptase/maturase [Clostridium muellerianum]NMM64803.1 group II intron reverse transcriptase/maturase [Clostridium muellerianum]